MATCRRCHQRIAWARNSDGRVVPVDSPSLDGALALFRDARGQLRMRPVTAAAPLLPAETRGAPHPSGCAPGVSLARRRPVWTP